MLDAVIRFALKKRMLVIALTAFTVVYGWITLRQLSVDVFPDLNRPMVNVLTDVPGMAPEEVEVTVTRPIESVLNGAPGVTHIYSSLATGLSVVRIEFEWGTNLKDARIAVAERLTLAKERMPDEAHPMLSPTSSIMGEIQMIGLTSRTGKISPVELRTIADWTIRQRLLSVPGVSQVTVIGGGQKQIQIHVNPDKARTKLMGIEDIFESVSQLSAASGGGFITEGSREWLFRNYGRVLDFNEIADTPIGRHLGQPVQLKDVARIDFAPAPKRGDASVNGVPGVILMVQKQPTADTLKVSERVDAILAELKGTIDPDAELHGSLFKQAEFIETSISNVIEALRDGTIIVAIILILFLLNVRTTIITLTAIPISLFITAIIFHFMGIGINTMTLGGLAIAIGELVDDAIVDVENVFRRLRENSHLSSPKPALKVVYEASSEIRNSIVLATVIVVLVFVPLFALPGVEGRLFTPIGIAYVVSILASLLVSITLTPVLCYYLLSKARFKDEKESWLVRKLKAGDRAVLNKTLNHPYLVMAFCILLVAASIAVLPSAIQRR